MATDLSSGGNGAARPWPAARAALLCALLAPAIAAGQGDPGAVQVRMESGLVHVQASGAPLSAVLRAIGETAGITVKLSGNLEQPVRRSMKGLPVDTAVRQLASDAMVVMLYTGGEAGAPPRLSEVRVYERSAGVAPLRTTSGAGPGAAGEAAAGAEERAQALLEAIQGMESPEVRVHAVRTLAARSDPHSAAIALGDLLSSDDDVRVRAAAVAALREIGGEHGAAALEQGLGDEDTSIRAGVVSALGDLGGEHTLMGLGQALFGDADAAVRVLAVDSLMRNGSKEARELLEGAAEDTDATVRDAARRALGRK